MLPAASTELLNSRSLLLPQQHPRLQQQQQQQQHITSGSRLATPGVQSNMAARRYPTSGGTFVMPRHASPSSSSSSPSKSVGDVQLISGGTELVPVDAESLMSVVRSGARTASQFPDETTVTQYRQHGTHFAMFSTNHLHQPRLPQPHHNHRNPVVTPPSSYCSPSGSGSVPVASPANGELVLDLRAVAVDGCAAEQPLDLTGGSDARKRHRDQSGDFNVAYVVEESSSMDCRPLDLSVKRTHLSSSGSSLTMSSSRSSFVSLPNRNSIRSGNGSIHIAPAPVPLVQLQQHSMGLRVENVRYGLDPKASYPLPSGGGCSGDGSVPVIQRLSSSATVHSSDCSSSRFNSKGSTSCIDDERRRGGFVPNGLPMPIATASGGCDNVVGRRAGHLSTSPAAAAAVSKSAIYQANNDRLQYPQHGLRQLLPKSANNALGALQARCMSGTNHRSSQHRLRLPNVITRPPPLIRQSAPSPHMTSRGGRIRAQQWSLSVGVSAVSKASSVSTVIDLLPPGGTTSIVDDNSTMTTPAGDADAADGLYFRNTTTADESPAQIVGGDQPRPRENSSAIGGNILASAAPTFETGCGVFADRRSTTTCLSGLNVDESKSSSASAGDKCASSAQTISLHRVDNERNGSVSTMAAVSDEVKYPIVKLEVLTGVSSLNCTKKRPSERPSSLQSALMQRDLINLPSAVGRRLIPVANVHPIMKDSSTLSSDALLATVNLKPIAASLSETMPVDDKLPPPLPAETKTASPRTLIDLTETSDCVPASSASTTRGDIPDIPLLLCGGQGASSLSAALSSGGNVINSGRMVSSHHMEYVKFLQQTITSAVEETGGSNRGGTDRCGFAHRGRHTQYNQLVTPPLSTSAQAGKDRMTSGGRGGGIRFDSTGIAKKPSKTVRRGLASGLERSSTAVRRQLMNHFDGNLVETKHQKPVGPVTVVETEVPCATISGDLASTAAEGKNVTISGNASFTSEPSHSQYHVIHLDSVSPANDVRHQSDDSSILVPSLAGVSSTNKKTPIVYFDEDDLSGTTTKSSLTVRIGSYVGVENAGYKKSTGKRKNKTAGNEGDATGTRPKKGKFAQQPDEDHLGTVAEGKTNRKRKLAKDENKKHEVEGITGDGKTKEDELNVTQQHHLDVIDDKTIASNTSATPSDSFDPDRRGHWTAAAASSSAAATPRAAAAESAVAEPTGAAAVGAAKKRRRATNIDLLIGESGVTLSDIHTADATRPTGHRWKRRSTTNVNANPVHGSAASVATDPVVRRGRGAGGRARRGGQSTQSTRREGGPPAYDYACNDNEYDDVTGKEDQNEAPGNDRLKPESSGRPNTISEHPDGRRRMRGGASARRRQRSRHSFVSGSRDTLPSIDGVRPEMEMGRWDMESRIALKNSSTEVGASIFSFEYNFDAASPPSASVSDEPSNDFMTSSSTQPTTTSRFRRGIGRGRSVGRRRRGPSSFEESGCGIVAPLHRNNTITTVGDGVVDIAAIFPDVADLSATCDSTTTSGTIELESSGETVLHQAARFDYQEVVFYLLKSETISANVQDNCGRTPLHISSALGHITVARMLLASGAHPNCKTVDGTRPIHCAIANGHVHLVRELLQCGADVAQPDANGRTALQLASGRPMRMLIRGVLSDLGLLEDSRDAPWQFYPSFQKQGDDLLDDVPASDDEANDIVFESSREVLPPVYRFQQECCRRARNYYLLDDVIQSQKISDYDVTLPAATRCLNVTADMIENQLRTSAWNRSTVLANKLTSSSAVGFKMVALDDGLRRRTGVETTVVISDVGLSLRQRTGFKVKVKKELVSVKTESCSAIATLSESGHDVTGGQKTADSEDEKGFRLAKIESNGAALRQCVDRSPADTDDVIVDVISRDKISSDLSLPLPVLEKHEKQAKSPSGGSGDIILGEVEHVISATSGVATNGSVASHRCCDAAAPSRRQESTPTKNRKSSSFDSEDDDEPDMPELTLYA